jgi:hypothetical protein
VRLLLSVALSALALALVAGGDESDGRSQPSEVAGLPALTIDEIEQACAMALETLSLDGAAPA